MNRRQILTRTILLIGLAVAALAGWGLVRNAGPRAEARAMAEEVEDARRAAATSEREARAWLAEYPARGREFAALEAFLADQGVAGIVPAWNLLLTDPVKLRRCAGSAYMLPPRAEWPNIVPALRLVRERVIPAIGPVRVVSVRRDRALNACAGGAAQSRHLSFAALDMVPVENLAPRETFARLCANWRRAGARSGWGLGAYFDVARPDSNRIARFHVDGTGWRTWGYSRRGPSSGCHQLR